MTGWVEAIIHHRVETGLLDLMIWQAFINDPYLFDQVTVENTVEKLPPEAQPLEI